MRYHQLSKKYTPNGLQCERPNCKNKTYKIYFKPNEIIPTSEKDILKIGDALCDEHAPKS